MGKIHHICIVSLLIVACNDGMLGKADEKKTNQSPGIEYVTRIPNIQALGHENETLIILRKKQKDAIFKKDYQQALNFIEEELKLLKSEQMDAIVTSQLVGALVIKAMIHEEIGGEGTDAVISSFESIPFEFRSQNFSYYQTLCILLLRAREYEKCQEYLKNEIQNLVKTVESLTHESNLSKKKADIYTSLAFCYYYRSLSAFLQIDVDIDEQWLTEISTDIQKCIESLEMSELTPFHKANSIFIRPQFKEFFEPYRNFMDNADMFFLIVPHKTQKPLLTIGKTVDDEWTVRLSFDFDVVHAKDFDKRAAELNEFIKTKK